MNHGDRETNKNKVFMPSEQRGWSHLLLKLFNNPQQLQDMGERWDGNVTQLLISHNEASVQKIVFSPSKKLKGKGEPNSKIETQPNNTCSN